MTPDIDTRDLGLDHVQVIVRGMYAVAKADGVHDAELAMIRSFYDQCQSDARGLADFDDLIAVGLDRKRAKEVLDTPELQNVFLTSCVLLAYADGELTEPERATITELAKAIGVSQAQLDVVLDEVKDHLLVQISKIQNVDALREVAAEMGGGAFTKSR